MSAVPLRTVEGDEKLRLERLSGDRVDWMCAACGGVGYGFHACPRHPEIERRAPRSVTSIERGVVGRAFDALPPQLEVGDNLYDDTPEAAALHFLFGHSAFRMLDGETWTDGQLDGAEIAQRRAAEAYLFAIDAVKGNPAEMAALYQRFRAIRDRLIAAEVCLACGTHTPGSSCQCENDE